MKKHFHDENNLCKEGDLISIVQTRKLSKTKSYIKKISTKNKDIEKLEAKLSSFLGTKIKINGDPTKGEIIVPYKNTNDLNRILELLDII